jgi:hypothetical protein
MILPALLVVAPEETSFVPALEAVMAVAMVAVVPAKEPVMMFAAQHTREAVRCDAAQYPFGQ